MGVNAYVHTGIIAKIDMRPKAYTVNIKSCGNGDCANHGKELNSNFCPTCGRDIEQIDVKKYGRIGWYEFAESCDGEHEDVFETLPYGREDDEFQVLTHYEWGDDRSPNLDPENGNTATIAELQEHSKICKDRFELKHADAIKAAQEFFGNRFSYDYGICAYYS